jgi:hypothetical protein
MPASNSHKSKKQQAAAAAAAASKAAADADAAIAAIAADVIIVTIPSLPGKEIAVGALRHRICEPLLKGKTPGGDTVWEALGRAVEGASLTIPERLLSWDSIAVIGDMARFKSKFTRANVILTASVPRLARYSPRAFPPDECRAAVRLAAPARPSPQHPRLHLQL